MPGDTAFWRDPALPHVESRRACHSRACYKPHSHPTFSIGAVDAGGSIFTGSHGRQNALSTGSLVLVPAGCVHACNPLPGALWSYQMLHLDAAWLHSAVPQLDTDSAQVLHHPALYAQFCAMNALLFSSACVADKQAALLYLLHACAGASGARALPAVTARIPAQLRPAIAALQKQPLASLAYLAQVAGMSRYQLIRAFRAATGMTPHAYQLNLGVNRARDGLQAGTALADIACELGFADQSHLQRVFKAHAAITPGRYRA
ncbi:AraC family transcriptional regulator [Janthinobacterium sp. AD80]|uniref:helix-turn-helix transcriptional regulator n=1 Tax=Janthinobacterium sp. AD80 TaxID=1528773 RepID=UPI000C837CED|nr:AraC family transcriptional regulator [Janthinobacterium sp. AD80]PMQ16404.1 Bifunctional transcriptional activator/DNA repair enzyme Ada [Janthinobacterium sp. AD80]